MRAFKRCCPCFRREAIDEDDVEVTPLYRRPLFHPDLQLLVSSRQLEIMGAGASGPGPSDVVFFDGRGGAVSLNAMMLAAARRSELRRGSDEGAAARLLTTLAAQDFLMAQALDNSRRVGPPPAAADAIERLPRVKVSSRDVDENKVCAICLEAQEDLAVRLPCGHLFHADCIETWLRAHCTCPRCRYEIRTDDIEYEKGRRDRMRHRKPAYRQSDLMRMKVCDLRNLLRDAGADDASPIRGVCEKKDLVRCILQRNAVDIVPEADDDDVLPSTAAVAESSSFDDDDDDDDDLVSLDVTTDILHDLPASPDDSIAVFPP